MNLDKWAKISDIVSGAAIVITILMLVFELRTNSDLIERQIEVERIDRIATYNAAFGISEVLEKVKAVDGIEDTQRAFMDRYSLSFDEADRLVRYLRQQWQALRADYEFGGREDVESRLRFLLRFPDQSLFWVSTALDGDENLNEFDAFVAELPRYQFDEE